jgi:hypothetical protein
VCVQLYAPQTKILEGRNNRPERVFEALFKGVSTRFGLRIVEKCVESSFRTVGSAFQNLRLGGVNLRITSAVLKSVLFRVKERAIPC